MNYLIAALFIAIAITYTYAIIRIRLLARKIKTITDKPDSFYKIGGTDNDEDYISFYDKFEEEQG